jgi:hypothetical protein
LVSTSTAGSASGSAAGASAGAASVGSSATGSEAGGAVSVVVSSVLVTLGTSVSGIDGAASTCNKNHIDIYPKMYNQTEEN